MRKAILFLSFILLTCVGISHAQAVFKKYGFNKAPLTLSKGKYNEFFTNDEVVQIGTVRFNTQTNKVIEFLKEDTTKVNYMSDRSSIWYSVDPLAEKYPNYSPYVYCENNPIKYIDPDGKEPILKQAGRATGFVNTLTTTGSRMGAKVGDAAHLAMMNIGQVSWTFENPRPMPTNTGRINTFRDKYIYTKEGGWLDMSHFMFYAGKAYQYKQQKLAAQKAIEIARNTLGGARAIDNLTSTANIDPVAEAVQDGYYQEMSDRTFAKYSAYSYEDLSSDKFGAQFGANYFDPNSKLTFGEQLQNFLNSLGATIPQNAPNYTILPTEEPTEKPSRVNHTTTPVYTTTNP